MQELHPTPPNPFQKKRGILFNNLNQINWDSKLLFSNKVKNILI